jgi:hypothetical protein
MVEIDWKLTEGYQLLALLGETFHALFDARKKELDSSGVSMKRVKTTFAEALNGMKSLTNFFRFCPKRNVTC